MVRSFLRPGVGAVEFALSIVHRRPRNRPDLFVTQVEGEPSASAAGAVRLRVRAEPIPDGVRADNYALAAWDWPERED